MKPTAAESNLPFINIGIECLILDDGGTFILALYESFR
jgi:hypothetical protein